MILKPYRSINPKGRVPLEINIRKQIWLLLPLYRNPSQNQTYYVENLTRIVDCHSAYERVLITGDFSMEVTDKNLIPLIEAYELYRNGHILNQEGGDVLISCSQIENTLS